MLVNKYLHYTVQCYFIILLAVDFFILITIVIVEKSHLLNILQYETDNDGLSYSARVLLLRCELWKNFNLVLYSLVFCTLIRQ